ncbi:SUMO-interacting motif-containing protein 1 [Salarias fasciatus]|uniref:Uncharacterized protein n=1 Tax=Salarias fasciatus TaxID=181472 RepID=A0A672ILY1_SALFA|nr:SUMO-interacting motif-containing protein 1 [Salarias fasciatus]
METAGGGGGGGGGGDMDGVISVSSEDTDDSDVEVVGVNNRFTDNAEPLSSVRVDTVTVNTDYYVDLTDPRWSLPHLKLRRRHNSHSEAVIDLTETDPETENVPHDCQTDKEITVLDISEEEDARQENTSVEDATVPAPVQDCEPVSPQKENQQQNSDIHPRHHRPVIRLTRLPFLETHLAELPTSRCSIDLSKACTQMSLYQEEMSNIGITQHSSADSRTAASDVQRTESSVSRSPPVDVAMSHMGLEQREHWKEVARTKLQTQESQHPQSCTEPCCSERNVAASPDTNSVDDIKTDCSSSMISSPAASPSKDQDKSEVPCSNIEPLERKEAVSRQSHSSSYSWRSSPVRLSESVSPNPGGQSAAEPYSGDAFGNNSPVFVLWQDGSDDEDLSEERSFSRDFRAVTGENRHYVSPVALKKFMARPTQDLFDSDDDDAGAPEELSRQTLSQVYTTIEVNYPEGTLEMLFDLLQPGYYLPGDIAAHLLHGILLNRQCSQYQCVQAFNLLMRTQRHHMADNTTVLWEWELLTSVMANQEGTDKHRSEIVRMFLEYIIQTLEDDFHAKHGTSALQHSIAKSTLSCEQQFPRVRDVIKWLFSVITKSTECEQSNRMTKERDEHIRMVKVFQRMLSLALEVDRCPALSVAKLSQELFHMLISNAPLRAHRLLLLETIQSKRLKCKLLEHLLVYASPVKISLPMSLSLLLHFLKHSTLVPDPSDGTETWKKWDELMQLFWMLLLSYNKAMKGYLCSSKKDQRSKVSTLVYKPHDVISAPAVREAVEAFLSRSRSDLGEALPPHVEESLTYLQDHLLDACQREDQKTPAL